MPQVLASSFDALPYRHGAIPATHPARLGAIARLLGRKAASPDRCRVLELGCGEGLNLLPLAERFPASQFTGVDFSPEQIRVGEEARVAAKLGNARLICGDLRGLEPEAGAFDYVIAHGVYSWVSDEVKERLLAICSRALAPDGVAYVSYNVHPGWGLLGSLRAILRTELAGVADPRAHARRLLPALQRAFAGQDTPYARLMGETLAGMQAKPEALLFHDELEIVNDPVTFVDFTAHAGAHGLHYLAEADFASLPLEHLPPAAQTELAGLGVDFLRGQQLLDLLGNRQFRASLLTRSPSTQPPTSTTALDVSVIAECAVGLYLRATDAQFDLKSAAPLRLLGRHNFVLSIEKPAQRAFFIALCEVFPRRIAFAQAVARAMELLQQHGLPPEVDSAQLAVGLVKLFTIDQCDLLLAGGGEWLRPPPAVAAEASPLMRHQARTGLHVTNRWHEVMDLSEDDRRWVAGEAHSVLEADLVRSGLAV
jgi:SAM-dependent methyltransferase